MTTNDAYNSTSTSVVPYRKFLLLPTKSFHDSMARQPPIRYTVWDSFISGHRGRRKFTQCFKTITISARRGKLVPQGHRGKATPKLPNLLLKQVVSCQYNLRSRRSAEHRVRTCHSKDLQAARRSCRRTTSLHHVSGLCSRRNIC